MESEQTPLQPKKSSNDPALLSQPAVIDFAANLPTTRLNLLPMRIHDPQIEKFEGDGFKKLKKGFFGKKYYNAKITHAGMMMHSNQGVLILPEDSQFAFFSSLLPSSQAAIEQSKEQTQCILLQKNPNNARKIPIDPQKDSNFLDKVPRDWEGFDVKKDSVLFFDDDEKTYFLLQENNNARSLIVQHTMYNNNLFDATNAGNATALQIRRDLPATESLQTTNLTPQKIESRYFDQTIEWAPVRLRDDQYKHINEELTAQGIPELRPRFLRQPKPNAWELSNLTDSRDVDLSAAAVMETKTLEHWSDWITHKEDSPEHEILANRLNHFSYDPDKNHEFQRACVEYLPQEYSIIPTTDRKGLHPKKEEHWGSVTQERPDAYQQVSERVGYGDPDPSAVVGVISLRKKKLFPPWRMSETSYAFSDPSLRSETFKSFLNQEDTSVRISETWDAQKNPTLVIGKIPGKLKENNVETIDQSARPQSPPKDPAKLLEQAGANKNDIQRGKGHSPSQGRA
jgi:hypothetical protein